MAKTRVRLWYPIFSNFFLIELCLESFIVTFKYVPVYNSHSVFSFKIFAAFFCAKPAKLYLLHYFLKKKKSKPSFFVFYFHYS